MRLFQLQNLNVQFPGRVLIDDVTWSIFRGERYGLVGPNGAGKTTLLKILIGEFELTAGEVMRSRGVTTGYLPQSGLAYSGRTLFEEAWSGIPDLPAMEQEIDSVRCELEADPANEDLLERLGVLEHRWQDLEGYHAEAKVAAILHGLSFKESDHGRRVEEFSGGWQMRIALARLLLKDPDLLLLDEPTNHLDLQTLLWLENYLAKYAGTQIIVSHDRSFLDRAVDCIAEIDRAELTLYPGNYHDYETARDARREQLEKEQQKIDVKRKHLESFVERFRYKATKAKQAQSRVKQLEKLEDVEIRSAGKRVRFRFPSAPASGQNVLEFENVSKHYGSIRVFDGVNTVFRRGERIALVGINGSGKSTFCRLVSQGEQPTSGTAKLGHNVVVDYFSQEADAHLDPANDLLEEMESEGGGLSQTQLRGVLGAFLFTGDDVYKRVSVLSGGEKSRLALARMLLRPSNFIILDEPTNHLDMTSQDVLLDALKAYNGTLLVVSHDRYFLDRLVTRVLELVDGRLHDWPGTLSEYIERKGLDRSLTEKTSKLSVEKREQTNDSRAPGSRKTKEQKRAEAEIRNRFSSLIRKQVERSNALQGKIDRMEARRRKIEKLLTDEGFYSDPEVSKPILAEYKKIQAELPGLLEEWEEVALKQEELTTQRDAALRAGGAPTRMA